MKKNKKETPERHFLERIGEKKGLIAAGIIGLLFILFFVVQLIQSSKVKSSAEEVYGIHIVQEENPIIFDGVVRASTIQEEHYDPSLGVISEILVEDGQKVEAETDLFTYTNEESRQLLDEQNRQFSRMKNRLSGVEIERANARSALSTANANIEASKEEIDGTLEIKEDEMVINAEYESAQNDMIAYETDKVEAEGIIENTEMTIRELNEQMEDMQYEIEKLKDDIRTTIKADFSGVIEMSSGSLNELEAGDHAVMRVLSENVEIAATLSEYDYEKVKKGDPVKISVVNSDKELDGTITKISASPFEENTGGSYSRYTFLVKSKEVIHYGFSVRIGYSEGVTYLPQEAVLEDNGKYVVFVNNEETAEVRGIKVSEEGNVYLLESGLNNGEEVLMDPSPELADGDEIMVVYD